jgi:hypothetical protein
MKQQAGTSDSKMLDALTRLCRDPQPVHIECDKATAWRVVATIQLACRHPEFKGQVREAVEGFARQLGESLTANDPDLRMLLSMGWEQTFDHVRK